MRCRAGPGAWPRSSTRCGDPVTVALAISAGWLISSVPPPGTISPVHAQVSATPDRFSPYSPSSRTLLNVLHAKLDLTGPEAARLEAMDLVDWPAATQLRLGALDAAFEEAERGSPLWDEFQRFRAAEGAGLEGHARRECCRLPIRGRA